ncbi:restriction endonuclease [Aeromonas schubertii]|uniref:Restriction endonuclease n=1 Tax=Aeromonas schubertii TaxID=652 RepID=A0ABS7VEX8_9GAMM|nr:restriction endonuclease [Aeromonas schubertii]MBZ6067944.1 restriction endonuclease [Aeromonas schubertii]
MIENPKPSDWKELQSGVCRILNEVGIAAETEKSIETPRGTVEIDVYGVDESSVEKIRYIVECKNWGNAIPQTVVHAFTSVLHETGGHIGILISKEGFQEGALSYIQHTNIVALTYAEFQERYFKLWYVKNFCVEILGAIDDLLQYVEPINSRRQRFLNELDDEKKSEYESLSTQYQVFTMVMAMLSVDKFAKGHEPTAIFDIEDFKSRLVDNFGEEFRYQANYYRDLVIEISDHASKITEKFHAVFGRNIFA